MKHIPKRIEVLFENDECVVLNKPAGLPVQGGAGVTLSLDSILRDSGNCLEPAVHLDEKERLLLTHRLDRDTSGVLLAAKGREAAAKFSALFASSRGTVRKRYLAVCAGKPRPESGVITINLDIRGKSKTAKTDYTRLSGGALPGGNAEFSLMELELGTGRMHQIRRHLRQIGCPVLGDDKYGDFALNKALRKQGAVKRLLLHAARLVIAVEGIDVNAPPPDCFAPFTGIFYSN